MGGADGFEGVEVVTGVDLLDFDVVTDMLLDVSVEEVVADKTMVRGPVWLSKPVTEAIEAYCTAQVVYGGGTTGQQVGALDWGAAEVYWIRGWL